MSIAVMEKTRNLTAADEEAANRLRGFWEVAQEENEKLTQETAALDMKMTQGAVSQFLQGKVALGVGPTLKFAKLLNVNPLDIRPDFDELLGAIAKKNDLLDEIKAVLPEPVSKEISDYLLFKIERADEGLFLGEKAARYAALIERIKRDMDDRKMTD